MQADDQHETYSLPASNIVLQQCMARCSELSLQLGILPSCLRVWSRSSCGVSSSWRRLLRRCHQALAPPEHHQPGVGLVEQLTQGLRLTPACRGAGCGCTAGREVPSALLGICLNTAVPSNWPAASCSGLLARPGSPEVGCFVQWQGCIVRQRADRSRRKPPRALALALQPHASRQL
jgi:hypothetical protein